MEWRSTGKGEAVESMKEEEMEVKDDTKRGIAARVTEKGPELNDCQSRHYPTSNTSAFPARSQQRAEGSLHLHILVPRR